MLVPSNNGMSSYYKQILWMRNELKVRFKFDKAYELPTDDVEEAYEAALQSLSIHEQHQVRYPLYPTNQLKKPTEWNSLFSLEFCKGGAFVSDPNIRDHLPALLGLFASFITYDKKKHTEWKNDPSVYDALPEMLIKFAKGSRIDSGYRLLERCVRHSHDPRMQSMFDNTAEIIQTGDGSLGIKIKAQVPASMKADVYETSVAHTANDLLAAECNCKSGSKDDDRVVCVHILPVPNKVTHLLYEGLAEHILIEFAASYASLHENWSDDIVEAVKSSVLIIMEAAGETVSNQDANQLELDILLERFVTGTERVKTWNRRGGRAKVSEQGPITKLSVSSPAKLEEGSTSYGQSLSRTMKIRL
jgi:hypothetical protein